MFARAIALLVVISGISVVGCAPLDEDEGQSAQTALLDCGDVDVPHVEVGTGTWQFESIAEGTDVSITSGPQGGHHVWISVRAPGLGPRVRVSYEIRDADDGTLLTSPGLNRVVTLADGEALGLLGFLASSDPAALSGRRVILEAWAEDACHEPVSATVEATLVFPGG